MTRRGFLTAAAWAAVPVRSRTVYAWYPAKFGSWETKTIPWDALTHISFRSVNLTGDGTLLRSAGNPPKKFLDEARRHGVKVSVLIWAPGRKESDSYIAGCPLQAAQNLAAYVKENGLDGICYDDENLRETNSVTGAPNRPLVTQFFRMLRDALPKQHISYAAPPVIAAKDRFGAHWPDWKAIADLVDAIIPMLYISNPPSIGWTTNPEPLAGGGSTPATAQRDIVTLMGDYIEAVGRKEKLLLGISSLHSGGYEFRSRTDRPLSPILRPGVRQPYEYLEAQARKYGKRRDEKQQSAWYVYPEDDHFVQGWYDDDDAWKSKLNYVNEQGLGGIGIWVLDGAADPAGLTDALGKTR